MRTSNTEWRDAVMADVAAAEATADAEEATAIHTYLTSLMGQPAYAYEYV
jgi:hypothetical protein